MVALSFRCKCLEGERQGNRCICRGHRAWSNEVRRLEMQRRDMRDYLAPYAYSSRGLVGE